MEHRFPAFVVEGVTPADTFSLSGVRSVTREGLTVYTGTFENALGVATSRAATSIAPGGSWNFETSAVSDPGVAHAAFADAATP